MQPTITPKLHLLINLKFPLRLKEFSLGLLALSAILLGQLPLKAHAKEVEFFRSDLQSWRREFQRLVENLNKQAVSEGRGHKVIQLDRINLSYAPELEIVYAFLPSEQTQKTLLVLNSGIHGVEASFGVFFQHYFLENCWNGKAEDGFARANSAVLIIHVMNPFGAINGRRFNGHNVDLNRNCFFNKFAQEQQFPGERLSNPEYTSLRYLLERSVNQLEIIWAALVSQGRTKMTKALRGQYSFPQGIYYGGRALEPECQSVQSLVTKYAATASNVGFFDFHTGLGKSGINQIMWGSLDSEPGQEQSKAKELGLLKELFSDDVCRGVCELQVADVSAVPAAKGNAQKTHEFYTNGDITEWVNQEFSQKRKLGMVLSVTAEMGTTQDRFALEAIINENFCFWNRENWFCKNGGYQASVQELRQTFSPSASLDESSRQASWWQGQVVKASKQLCGAMAKFSRL